MGDRSVAMCYDAALEVRLPDLLIDLGYQLADLLRWSWRAVAADLAYQNPGSPA
jgi:hypothetical protein